MTEREIQRKRDLALLTYIDALEAGDLQTARLAMRAAEADPVFARMIDEYEESACQEMEREEYAADAERVRAALAAHLPAAMAPDAEPPGLTVGDVAAQVKLEAGASPAAQEAAMLSQDHKLHHTALPEDMSVKAVRHLFQQLGIQVSKTFVELFRRAAVPMQMKRDRQVMQLAAARKEAARKKAHPEPSAPDQEETR